ncbi:tryptophan aminotransferase-related protein 2-like [Dorcoceras hygrometricum]|uniref:Tryptophan aminotransferase-related protein 2-like n=1 Tax=Dorcoceras hygrometricum TaxID=472368 RepID=A0A2Z7CZP2_9LAMI|nr:tryptophan aminotransferase-related protein 2-like [Dorcoceras hygrometricum]
MELKTMILGHFLVISLALNAGLLYRDYCNNGKHKSVELFSFKNEGKNESLATKREAFTERPPFESSSSKVFDGVIDLDQ